MPVLLRGVVVACPNRRCSASSRIQRPLSEYERGLIKNLGWADDALICGYCGCIYTVEWTGRIEIKRDPFD